MGETTGISWCDHTFNPWIGCTKVSAGCANCYAEREWADRRHRVKWGANGTRSATSYAYWHEVFAWDRAAKRDGVRRRVFCASLADVFEEWDGQVVNHKGEPLWFDSGKSPGDVDRQGDRDCDGTPTFRTEEAPDCPSWTREPLTIATIRAELFRLIERTPNLDWMLLTKRPENVMRMVPEWWRDGFPFNVWMGASVENQPAADERVPALLGIPARVRFLSCEPLLGSIDRGREQGFHQSSRWGLSWIEEPDDDKDGVIDALRGENWIEEWWDAEGKDRRIKVTSKGPRIHLVIVGGESGKNARPMHPAWARSIRDQCKAAGVAYFHKQNGEWIAVNQMPPEENDKLYRSARKARPHEDQRVIDSLYGRECIVPSAVMHGDGSTHERDSPMAYLQGTQSMLMFRVGTKAAGHLLDGKEHHEFPNAASAATPDQKPKEEA